jgi:myo-inositol-1(or 4)-monophosphatase
MEWQSELDLAIGAARAASELLLASFSVDAGVQSREGKDIKTRADVEVEACILRYLAPSGLPVLAEETARDVATEEGMRWLVDPLDGTMNFSRGFPMHAVSIALWDRMTPVLGVVYDLPRKVLYFGCIGAGAWRNDMPLRVSSTAECGQAILATGFPTYRDYETDSLAAFVGRIQSFKKIRMIGSAAISLALVAEGVFDAYFEEDIMIWDVAAGLALVAAVGGQIEVRQGRGTHSVNAKATNGLISF